MTTATMTRTPQMTSDGETAEAFHALDDTTFWEQVEAVRAELEAAPSPEEGMARLEAAINHPIWQVRVVGCDIAHAWSHYLPARELLCEATHDAVDAVAFRAIRHCGALREPRAVSHLVRISGWPSYFTREDYKRKPVGIGASLTKHALTTIFDSTDPTELKARENDFLAPYRALLDRKRAREPDLSTMVHIPEGPTVTGVDSVEDFPFFYKDFLPRREVHVDAFYIDRDPVSNADYAVFLDYARAHPDKVGHPDAPPNKDYTPSHWRDPRFADPALPVTGVDWYDAWAYADWAGKALPDETQWEKAARGPDGHVYPWGDTFEPEMANYVETCFGRPVASMADWEDLLRTYSDETPARTVQPANARKGSESVYGVRGLAGNTWEWTRTNFYDHKDMDPFFKGRHPREFMNRPAAFAVIRGGCFTSRPEMLRGYYRGKDLLTDRHCEIGFRCVWQPPKTS